jgi:hypothetical protein
MLTERGLGPALASLAERAPVPVRLAATSERLPAVIETAVYFVCSEALARRAACSPVAIVSSGNV